MTDVGGVILYGAGGHAKVIFDILESEKKKILGIIDDDPSKWRDKFLDFSVMGFEAFCQSHGDQDCRIIISVGDNSVRKRIANKIVSAGKYFFETAIHSSVILGKNVMLGEGTVVMPGGVINCGTRIGVHSILNTRVSVDHDCEIGDYVHISPGAQIGGGVAIESGSWIGLGSSIINNCRIGQNVIVGMGSVVLKDIPDSWVVAGNPARFLRMNNEKYK